LHLSCVARFAIPSDLSSAYLRTITDNSACFVFWTALELRNVKRDYWTSVPLTVEKIIESKLEGFVKFGNSASPLTEFLL